MYAQLTKIARMLNYPGKDRNRALQILKGNNPSYEHLQKIDQKLYAKVLWALKDTPKKKTIQQHLRDYFNLSYAQYREITKKGCSNCRSHKKIHLHHILPKSQGGSNDLKNLTPLCEKCHLKVHGKTKWTDSAKCHI